MRKPLFFKSALGLSQLWLATVTSAIDIKSITQPQLNLDDLGKVGLAGDFDAISVYAFEGQKASILSQNGSDSVLLQLPNGAFTPLVMADANIEAICTFELKNGTVVGIAVGGNFTSLGGVQANGIALLNPDNGKVTALTGLTGKVNALHCDKESDTLYVGGEFKAANSSNALAWSKGEWQDLAFEGFNKPVKSIVKSSTGNIVFSGLFDGLGNNTAPASSQTQTLNLQTAAITTEQSSGRVGFNDPKSITCGNGPDAAGTTWLLGDGQVGSWTADFGFGFRPTKLRLRNTHLEGRGTKEFRFTAFPIGGILNLTYVDPADQKKKFCDSRCPLSSNSSVEFQDFEFVNVIGMNNFRLDILSFYGPGAGLAGIQVFQDDVYTFAINNFNEPLCAAQGGLISSAKPEGQWTPTTGNTDSQYLVATVPVGSTNPPSVTFSPNVQQSGDYSVIIFTPGCIQDGSCGTRGRVTVSGIYTSDQTTPVTVDIFQTNNFDKYDTIYQGQVDAASSGFRPTVNLAGSLGQTQQVSVVAHKVRFDLISNTTLGLNGLYEHKPGSNSITSFKDSVVIKSTDKLNSGARITALASKDSTLYAAGNFTSKDSNDGYNNVYGVNKDGPLALSRKGLNAPVLTLYADGKNTLYLGGEFTNTKDSGTSGLDRIASYDTSSNTWAALGAGVNGRVKDLVPMSMTINGETLDVLAVSGDFTEIIANGDKQAVRVAGFAVWVPSSNEWLQRLENAAAVSLKGRLSASSTLPQGVKVFSGSISSSDLIASGAVTLKSASDKLALSALPLNFVTSNSTIKKRDTPIEKIEGVTTGAFYQNNGKELTIIGGHFSLQGNNETINNLAIIDHKQDDEITGLTELGPTGTFVALHIHNDILYAGGSVTGKVGEFEVGGLILYDLDKGELSANQPARLQGGNATVNTISTRPKSDKVFVGGNFAAAGSFQCPVLCVYEASNLQWTRPGGNDIGGTINQIQWLNIDELLVVGDMKINDTTTYIAKYNAKTFSWSAFGTGDNTKIPGPISGVSLDSDNGNSLFITGSDSEAKPYVWKWTGTQWKDLGTGLATTSNIRGLQVMKLKQKHASNDLLNDNHILILTGAIKLQNSTGTFSGVTYNGVAWSPLFLTSKTNSGQSSLGSLFFQREQNFTSAGGKMKKGFVVLISLAIALGLVFLIVVLGVLASYIRRRKEGYQPAPTVMLEKSSSIQDRVPPAFLFGSVGTNSGQQYNAPTI
ncbi:cortical protein marker for cell polarity-domain-containing protein [Peziza echinospora]|nr:cortical protein marker for cell polarity-domain-containing protein [Peziza echinospora]